MNTNLVVKVSKRVNDGVESWEGTATLPGALPTKLVKANTKESKFNTRSALTNAAQRFATRYGFSDVQFEGQKATKKKTASKKKAETLVETN